MALLPDLQSDFALSVLSRDCANTWGLAAYRANSFGNWTAALANAYPIVRKIVGEEFFDALAREYARRFPSTSGDLNEYGARLPNFVADFGLTQDLPYLPDVARMEWAAHGAYYAPDAVPLDPAMLATLSAEAFARFRPKLVPACALMCSEWPLARIWAVHQDAHRGAIEVDFAPGPHRIVVWRPRWQAIVRSVDLGEYLLLEAVARGDSLGNALESAAAGDGAFCPASAFARWIGSGALAA